MVSSKCCQVESPSPLRFLAALIPPCAQTEWERFTGTMENRSHWPPISAILMTAARPASPPPTTMILGAAILLHPLSVGRLAAWLFVGLNHGTVLVIVCDRSRTKRIQTCKAYSAEREK